MTAAEATAPKGARVAKATPVDRKFYEDKIQEIDDEIKGLKTKVQSLNKTISSQTTGKEEFYTQRDAIKAELDVAQRKIDECEKKRNQIGDQIKKLLDTEKESRTEVQKMQKSIGFQSEEQIDREIAEIEYQMHTESLTLKREKELMTKVSQLKQVKPQLNKLSKMKDGQPGASSVQTVGSLKAQQAEIQKELAAARAEKQKHSAAFGKILEARKKAMGGVSQYVDEREKLQKEIGAKIAEIKALKDERSQKIAAFNAYLSSQREVRAEREKIEKVAKDAEREMKKKQSDLQKDSLIPFKAELDLIDNMIRYCEKLQPTAATEEAAPRAPVTALEGTDVLVSKKERDAVYFVAPTSVKKNQNAKKESSTEKPITHSIETLGLFAEVKVTPPTSVKDVPATVEQLKAKIEEFKGKQTQEIEDRKTRRAEREAAFQAAAEAFEKASAEAKKLLGTADDF
jgi:uncharacterized coiled-coil DUF342 family protein